MFQDVFYRWLSTLTLAMLAMLISLNGSALQAQQDDAPTAIPPFDIFSTTNLIFPQAVQFEMSVALPAEDIVRIILEVDLPNGDVFVVQFANEGQIATLNTTSTANRVIVPFTFAREYVIVRYEWLINDAPALFEPIRYRWLIAGRENVYNFAEEILYQDGRFTWQSAEADTAPLTLWVAGNIGENAQQLLRRVQNIYDYLAEQTGLSPSMNLLVYPTGIDIGCDRDETGEPIVAALEENVPITKPCDIALAERVSEGYITLQIAQQAEIGAQIAPYIIEQFYAPLWANTDVPAWFEVGLSQMLAPRPPSGAMTVSRTSLRSGRALSLEAMAHQPEDNLNAWRAQAYGMVLYIAESQGLEVLFGLAQGLSDYGSFTQAYEALIGQNLASLIPAWEVWVYSARAEVTYGYSVYSPTTPTPTATPTMTATRIPPTVSDTPTATIFMTNTPVPTRTPIPPTATTTPLPAEGFIVRSTPLPTPIPEIGLAEQVGLNESQLIVLGIVAGLVILLLGTIFVVGQRDN